MVAARANPDWMIWSSIAPDTNGQLVISLTTGGDWGVLNAARISEIVPEPGTLVLVCTASLTMLVYAWRRRRS
jgi:hypothetical protein